MQFSSVAKSESEQSQSSDSCSKEKVDSKQGISIPLHFDRVEEDSRRGEDGTKNSR